MNAVWVVDDDQSIRWVLEKALTREGFEVRLFPSARECLAALESDRPAALMSDIRMPGESGIELLQSAKRRHPTLPIIIMTAFSDLESAVSAFQGGAFEYLPKPFDLPKAVELLRRAVQESATEAVNPALADSPVDMLGQAPAMQEVFRAIGRLSQSHVTVLITGESGTGKELVARALHKHSPRADKVFVALNTAAIPRDLLESELFGHERGSFTGAQQMRRGRFEQADGGTLFLDEIGDMPAELQTRLLRVLSDGHFYRVGGHQPIRANVRVIAATHQNLEERVRQGLFREDLFHRLNVIRLRLPALRERADDIPLLTRHFLVQSARELGGEPKRMSEDALQVMGHFGWPGNVRQLENVCRWLTVMAPTQMIEFKDLPPEIRDGAATAIGGVQAQELAGLAAGTASGAAPGEPLALVHGGAVGPVQGVAAHHAAPLNPQPPGSTGRAEPLAWNALPARSAPVAGPWAGGAVDPSSGSWEALLEREVSQRLAAQPPELRLSGESDLMAALTRQFEASIIRTTLRHTRGRRIDAALRLGIGRNTITRKIQELRLEDDAGA
jgi:two-component system nitrogen regulation response regulator GlnG